MKTHSQSNKTTNSSIQTKAKNQAPEGSILQAYKKGTAQLQSLEEEEPVQGKFETAQLEELAEEDEEPAQLKENKTGLPDNLKSGVENLSGHSLDDVKVHYNSAKPAELQAHAYAQGTDIHVAPGQEKHLPHEAWHVVQQKQGRVKPTKQLKGTTNINDDTGLEKEADVMGAKAMQFKKDVINHSNNIRKSTTNLVQLKKTRIESIVGDLNWDYKNGKKLFEAKTYTWGDAIGAKQWRDDSQNLTQTARDNDHISYNQLSTDTLTDRASFYTFISGKSERMYVHDGDTIHTAKRGSNKLPHPTLVGGDPDVKGAGTMQWIGNKRIGVSKSSGHFQPDSVHDDTISQVQELAGESVTVEKTAY